MAFSGLLASRHGASVASKLRPDRNVQTLANKQASQASANKAFSQPAVNQRRRIMLVKSIAGMIMVAVLGVFAFEAAAQPGAVLYGAPISLENAKKAAAAAVAEARKNNWNMIIAVTDIAGTLVYFEKMDGTATGPGNVAIAKARSAAIFKAPTKVFQERLAAGATYLLVLGVMPLEGGIPLVMDGKIVGAIGASGGSFQQDGQVATAGAGVLK
jgi:uncharacterized protein GlcG (DUF336 family)